MAWSLDRENEGVVNQERILFQSTDGRKVTYQVADQPAEAPEGHTPCAYFIATIRLTYPEGTPLPDLNVYRETLPHTEITPVAGANAIEFKLWSHHPTDFERNTDERRRNAMLFHHRIPSILGIAAGDPGFNTALDFNQECNELLRKTTFRINWINTLSFYLSCSQTLTVYEIVLRLQLDPALTLGDLFADYPEPGIDILRSIQGELAPLPPQDQAYIFRISLQNLLNWHIRRANPGAPLFHALEGPEAAWAQVRDIYAEILVAPEPVADDARAARRDALIARLEALPCETLIAAYAWQLQLAGMLEIGAPLRQQLSAIVVNYKGTIEGALLESIQRQFPALNTIGASVQEILHPSPLSPSGSYVLSPSSVGTPASVHSGAGEPSPAAQLLPWGPLSPSAASTQSAQTSNSSLP